MVSVRAAVSAPAYRSTLDRLLAYLFSDRKRGIQTALGLIWLLDGALQFQSFMYGPGFIKSLSGMASGQPHWLGLSPTIWLILAGGGVIWGFMSWENRVLARGGQPLVDPSILRNSQLRAGLTTFFAQYFVQGGLFFAVPLFLSVALGLSAIETGVRLLPLSVTLLIAAAGIPRYFPNASPRRVAELAGGESSRWG